jgi:hypothetical protein
MTQPGPKILEPNIRRRRWGRVARDSLLLPPALLYVIVEQVFWRGAKRLLRQTARIPAIAALQARLERLPAAAILPLFLVPEFFSHLGGFWASDLLVRRDFTGALAVGVLVKGTATILEVWIYYSCEEKLLSVAWFAWVHRKFFEAKDWVVERTLPARRLIAGGRSGIARRFTTLRVVLARRMGRS